MIIAEMMVLAALAILLVCIAGYALALVLWTWGSFSTGVPFVSVSQAIVPQILSALDVKSGSVLFDLGCGDGRVLFAALECQDGIGAIGIEKALFPYWIARRKADGLTGNRAVTIRREDLFTTDLTSATHIFLYLFPELMNRLLPKFQKELRPGTRVVPCDFTFAAKSPSRVIDLDRPGSSLGKTLYVYEF